jgi:hypothetical protein
MLWRFLERRQQAQYNFTFWSSRSSKRLPDGSSADLYLPHRLCVFERKPKNLVLISKDADCCSVAGIKRTGPASGMA